VTSGSDHDPLPLGNWVVTSVVRNPTYNYNPDLFWDADPANAKAKIAAGPNNPVGVVWIGINEPHYGMHGTPEPGFDRPFRISRMRADDKLGRRQSRRPGHTRDTGCVRGMRKRSSRYGQCRTYKIAPPCQTLEDLHRRVPVLHGGQIRSISCTANGPCASG